MVFMQLDWSDDGFAELEQALNDARKKRSDAATTQSQK